MLTKYLNFNKLAPHEVKLSGGYLVNPSRCFIIPTALFFFFIDVSKINSF